MIGIFTLIAGSNDLMTKLLFILNKGSIRSILALSLLLLFGCDWDKCDSDTTACNYAFGGNALFFTTSPALCTYPTEDSLGFYIDNTSDGSSLNYDCNGNCISDSDCDTICDPIDDYYDYSEGLISFWGQYCYYMWEGITHLNLSYSELTGEIPSEIGNLTNLTYLGLYSNQLTGEIPPEIGNLTNLTYLGLYSNQLTGEIPQEVCDLIESNNLNINAILNGNDDLINTCDD